MLASSRVALLIACAGATVGVNAIAAVGQVDDKGHIPVMLGYGQDVARSDQGSSALMVAASP